MKRRDFIVSGGAAALALGPGAASAVAAMGTRAPRSLDKAAFAGLVNERFAIHGRGMQGALTLAEVVDVEGGIDSRLEQFSLRFDVPDGRTIDAGTHTLEHPALGTFALYLQSAEPGVRSSLRADFSLLPSGPTAA